MDVGFLGLGAMGSRMAANLAQAGHRVTAWNRSTMSPPSGVGLAESPAAVARAAGATFLVVGGPDDVDEVVFGVDGWAEGADDRSVLIQCTTIGPSATRTLASKLAEQGLRMIDAPVGGSTGPAQTGQLVIMAGGDAQAIDEVQPLFDAVSSKVVHFGDIGAGSTVKLLSNVVILAALEAVAEVWAWMIEAEPDLDIAQVAGVLERISPMLAGRMPDVAGDPNPPGFAIRHAAKDVRLAMAEAKIGPVVHATLQALEEADAAGLGDVDISALGKAARGRRT